MNGLQGTHPRDSDGSGRDEGWGHIAVYIYLYSCLRFFQRHNLSLLGRHEAEKVVLTVEEALMVD